MLNNPNFVSKAPEAKINQERAKLQDYTNKLQITKARLEEMKQFMKTPNLFRSFLFFGFIYYWEDNI